MTVRTSPPLRPEPVQGPGHTASAADAVVRAIAFAALAVAMAVLATVLASRGLDLIQGRRSVDSLVGAAAVAVGSAVAAWYAVAAVVSAVGWSARAAGRAWRSGERALRRWGPPAMRGALGLGIAATVGTGLFLAPAASAVGGNVGSAPFPASEAPPDDVGYIPSDPSPAPSNDAHGQVDGKDGQPSGPSIPAPSPGPAASPPQDGRGASTGPALSGAPSPDGAEPTPSATEGVPPGARATSHGAERAAPTHVVAAGESLWEIAEQALPAGAEDADVAAAWPRWFEANRAVVGDDPDLILPGQVLVVPEADR
ncbi:conserved hypothetical protein [Beutenbergia cavernae DSM 12333]|uniref:LysM domain-containing protein n=1 Tax=Beutenbergia cavernae (strain ATCC BAA-8 / DSM 12333 / CCUG 43141 / JCM 11478 / NBRC 16432 / NCIMB 13614 / HKI 0122) TaxID=471853 RepID=C5C1P6_BEUC1|nr:hypothetical protein [Beutenbergia cavernae]ACQ79514.1 conserved hypothetical protein [Beutenbergia cavernae DSM 12333]